MKKAYICIFIAVLALLSISIVSADLLDGFFGKNVRFENLTMSAKDENFQEGMNIVNIENYTIDLFSAQGNDSESGRFSDIAASFKKGSDHMFTEKSVTKAFKNADDTSDGVDIIRTDTQDSAGSKSVSKKINSLDKVSDFKEFNVSGHQAADFIVSESMTVDTSKTSANVPTIVMNGEKISDPTSDESKDANVCSRWVLVYDENTDTMYGVSINSALYDTLTDKTLLQTDSLNNIVDSIDVSS